MDSHSTNFKVKLGLFIAGGIMIFIVAVFIIGRQKNLFVPVYNLATTFRNVSGLEVGNNIRFSGINVGTIETIRIANDTTVLVTMLIQKNVQKFIKEDCEATIGSSGLIGDRILIISHGSSESPAARDGHYIISREPIETDEIVSSLKVTAENAEIVSDQLAEIMFKVNSGSGTLGRLIQDSSIAENITQTIDNLKKSSKGLDENMNAAKENFLFRGYFKRKQKEAENLKKEENATEKLKENAAVKEAEEQKSKSKK
jgi:phospholipid/cholesterol/gamma-HCH transport system substrate-binding protein